MTGYEVDTSLLGTLDAHAPGLPRLEPQVDPPTVSCADHFWNIGRISGVLYFTQSAMFCRIVGLPLLTPLSPHVSLLTHQP